MGLSSLFRRFLSSAGTPAPPTTIVLPIEPLRDDVGEDIFAIRGAHPWGGYGAVLVNGTSSHGLGDEPLHIYRSGPFMPPITFPDFQKIVVSEALRDAMIQAGFKGVNFRRALKSCIVKIHWERWDWNADEPKRYPPEGTPAWYLDAPHSESASVGLGEIWEALMCDGVEMERLKHPDKPLAHQFRAYRDTRSYADLFTCKQNAIVYCSGRAKTWFEKHVPLWVRFEPIPFAEESRPPEPSPTDPIMLEAAIVLYAAERGLLTPAELREWASRKIEALPKPTLWLVELGNGPLPSVNDALESLRAHAARLGHRRKLQIIMLRHAQGRLSLTDALGQLFEVQIASSMSFNLEDEPLVDALSDWDCLDNPDEVPEPLRFELFRLFADYLRDASEVRQILGR
jgi:hypothetical protein